MAELIMLPKPGNCDEKTTTISKVWYTEIYTQWIRYIDEKKMHSTTLVDKAGHDGLLHKINKIQQDIHSSDDEYAQLKNINAGTTHGSVLGPYSYTLSASVLRVGNKYIASN